MYAVAKASHNMYEAAKSFPNVYAAAKASPTKLNNVNEASMMCILSYYWSPFPMSNFNRRPPGPSPMSTPQRPLATCSRLP